MKIKTYNQYIQVIASDDHAHISLYKEKLYQLSSMGFSKQSA